MPLTGSKAVAQLYAPDATLYEPDATAKGHAAINQAVEALLSHLPPTFAFTAIGPAVGHHGIGRLRWQSVPVTATGPFGGPDCKTNFGIERGQQPNAEAFPPRHG